MSLYIGRYNVGIGAGIGILIGVATSVPFVYIPPVNKPMDLVYKVSFTLAGFALGGLVGGAIDYYRQQRSDKRPLGSR